MTSFQNNVLFITAAVIVVVCVGFGINFAIQSHNSHLRDEASAFAEQKTAWQEYNIRSLKTRSDVGSFTDKEQKRLDNAGNDVEHMRQALLDINQARETAWQEQLNDAIRRKQKIEALGGYSFYASYGEQIHKDESEAKIQLGGYAKALDRIEDWRPLSYEEYEAQKNAGTLAPGEDDFDQMHEIQEIWQSPYNEADVIDSAPKGKEATYRLITYLKKQTITGFNDDARTRGFSASWFLCAGGGAVCADIPTAQASSYESLVFSPGFHPDEVSGDPIATGLWRQGYWAVIIRSEDTSGKDEWVAKSPSPSGWVSLKDGVVAGLKRVNGAFVASETETTQ